MQITITQTIYHGLLSCLGNLYYIFLWGFLFFSVFLHLVRNHDYKDPNPKAKERELLYAASWMLCLWVYTTLLLIGLQVACPFRIV